MPEWLIAIGQFLGSGVVVALIVLICLLGVVLSCLSVSGTWLVLGATLLAMVTRGENDSFPSWITVGVFLLICIAVEVGEYAAGALGVAKRGGSKLAGWAALGGGLLGMLLGNAIPVLIVGPLIGMFIGSFGLVYLVEARRVRHEQAVSIAMGSVWARVAVMAGKVAMTMIMSFVLWVGMAIA